MRIIRVVALIAVTGSLLAACGGGGETTEPTDTGTPTDTDTGAPPASTELVLTAPVDSSNIGFAEKALSAPADTPFTITFKNDDAGIPHNVEIYEGDSASGAVVFAPTDHAMINGVAEVVYEIPALSAGTYFYNCFAHPATMTGTLTVA